jgi:hypothetical protein
MPLCRELYETKMVLAMWWNRAFCASDLSENQIDLGLDLFFPQRESYGVVDFLVIGLPCFQTRNPDIKKRFEILWIALEIGFVFAIVNYEYYCILQKY